MLAARIIDRSVDGSRRGRHRQDSPLRCRVEHQDVQMSTARDATKSVGDTLDLDPRPYADLS